MTRQIFGTLTFAALMSVILAKLFAQLALAADIPRAQVRVFHPAKTTLISTVRPSACQRAEISR